MNHLQKSNKAISCARDNKFFVFWSRLLILSVLLFTCLSEIVFSSDLMKNFSFVSKNQKFSISNEEWKLTRTKIFKSNDLYGHIDGGAELFLELGFKDLTVQYYSKGKDEITIEIYNMECYQSALGIYLFKCGKETPIKEIRVRNSGDRFQIVAVKNNCYVTVINSKGDKLLLKDMNLLMNNVLQKISDAKVPDIFSSLPKKDLIKKSENIIRGSYSLQSIYTFGEGDVLELNGKIFAVAGEYNDKNRKKYSRVVVKYISEQSAMHAFNHLLSNLDNTKKIIKKSSDSFIFEDHAKKFGHIQINGKTLDIKINLNSL